MLKNSYLFCKLCNSLLLGVILIFLFSYSQQVKFLFPIFDLFNTTVKLIGSIHQ